MNRSGETNSMKCRGAMLVWLMMFFPFTAEAVMQEISAVFKPDPANPQFNEFKNQTPISGFCLDNPPQCQAENMFSLRLPILSHSNATIKGGHNDVRQGAMFNIPSQWQTITVTHPSAPPQVVKFRIAGMGVSYKLPRPAPDLTGGLGHNYLFEGGTWSYAGSPCVGLAGAGNDMGFNSFWRHPLGAGTCAKKAMFDIPQPFEYETFDFTYELITPNPLAMVSGQYTGQHVFRVGPNQDFDLGNVMIPNDDLIVLDFVLDVQHTLKVDLPPGGNKVLLEPKGGWQAWINGGAKPTEIYRDQLFYLSASSRFKVMMLCESYGGSRCILRSPTGNSTEVEVRMSMPPGIDGPSGLLLYNTWVGPFLPSSYVDQKPGSLRFQMPRDAIDSLLKPGLNDTLDGNITIIWDSEI